MELQSVVPQAMDLVKEGDDIDELEVEYYEEGEMETDPIPGAATNNTASTEEGEELAESMSMDDFDFSGMRPPHRFSQRSLHSSLLHRETQRPLRACRELSIDLAAERLPHIMKERELPCNKFDKVFSSLWLYPDIVVAGTKDNQLTLWNVQTWKNVTIPLPNGSATTTTPDHNGGIHSICANPSKTVLATGAQNPNHVAIFRIPDFTPALVLEGHKDWVFASQFLDDDRLVTASRDTTVNVYSVSSDLDSDAQYNASATSTPVRQPLATRAEHTSKVRDLQYNKHTQQFATVSADGTSKLWDSSRLDVVSTYTLPDTSELVCLAYDETLDLIAVGSQNYITFVDPRASTTSAAVINKIPSQDENWGVRSVSFQRARTLTVGGGMGRVSFFDLRAGRWFALEASGGQPYVSAGKGWLAKDENYYAHFAGMDIANAVYTHSYDPTGARMFVGGGPLMLGLRGCYSAIWS